MKAERQIEKVQTALQRRFRIAGRGSVNRVQQSLNLGVGYFKNQRRSGRRRVDLRVLLDTLEILDVDAGEFFATILGAADPIDKLKTDTAVLQRKRRQPPLILALESQRSGCETAEEVDLAELEELRVRDPRAVIRRAKTLITMVSDTQVPTLLGIYASACRLLDRSEEAQLVLGRALEIATDLDDPKVMAMLYQRASYLAYTRGQLDVALELSERATMTYVQSCDLVGVGMTLVDQGIWQATIGDNEASIHSFRCALQYLPEDSTRTDVLKNRFGCLMNLGLAYLRSGDLDRASRFSALASGSACESGPLAVAKIAWLRASIAKESRRYEDAESSYQEAIVILQPISPLEAAVCTLELVKVKLSLGHTPEAYQRAKEMAALIEPLQRHSQVAAAALTELIRCALTGHGLSATVLDRVAKSLEDGRARSAAAKPAPRSRS